MRFSLDIGKAYENREDIHKWERSFVFDKSSEEIRVTETFDLQKEIPVALRFLTPQKASFADNTVTLSSPEGQSLIMKFHGADFAFAVEDIVCDDTKIKESWPRGLRIITLETKGKSGRIEYMIK